MSVSPADLINLAKTLNVGGCSETQQRAVVSRSYYAAYHGCYVWHLALPVPGTAGGAVGGTHDILISSLASPMVKGQDATKSKMRAYKLRALKVIRVKADYKLNEDLDPHHSGQAIADSESILAI